MANTVPITEKPIPAQVSKDAYVMGVQDNGSGQAALYRIPLHEVRANGANDLFIIPSLIAQHGMDAAFKAFAEANAKYDTLTNICNRFFSAAALSDTGTYTSEFYKFTASNSTLGEKLNSNLGLICEPSTNGLAAQDDYAALPLFACYDVNYTIDPNTLEPVIHAVKGVYGPYSDKSIYALVGVMQMTGWVQRTCTDTKKTVNYKAVEAAGYEPLPEAVRASDNSVRGFVIHAKYAAGRNASGQLSSVSGVQPCTYRPGSAGHTGISHDGQINLWREWGTQYGGFSLCDIAFYQLMLELKYAVLGSAQKMQGCRSYGLQYTPAAFEENVTRVLLTADQARNLLVGSCVSVGTSNDRGKPECYALCDIVPIVSIEDTVVGGVTYKAVNLDTDQPFTTTAASYIVTQPWRTGATDNVQGNDGSPYNNQSQKEPFKLQGIELMLGFYEVPGDTTLYQDENNYTVYLNRKAADVRSGNSGVNPVTVGLIPKEEAAAWKYVAELNWEANSQEAYMLGQLFTASSSNGYRCGNYRNGKESIGWRVWPAFGALSYGGSSGLACAGLHSGLGAAYWHFGARAAGSGGNRGEFTPAGAGV